LRKYVLKRIGVALVVLMLIVLILFTLLEFMPGSPFNDEKLSDEQIAVLEHKYGLDQPIVIRFGKYLLSLVQGDFGVSYSITKDTAISLLLKTRVPTTLRVGGQAVLLGTVIGLNLGIIAALKHNTIFDTLTTVVSVLGVSLPSYVFALALSYQFGYKMRWFPLIYDNNRVFFSSVLPTIALSMFTIATVARFTRTEMLEVLGSDYMLLAESKGISGPRLIFRHAIRNAMIPIITVLAPLIVGLMTGSLVIEKIFAIPGIGSLMVQAIQTNDFNVIIVLAFIYSLMYVTAMLVVDILYGVIDPRIRLAKGDI
jgi:oligopeptide transport system permease protein